VPRSLVLALLVSVPTVANYVGVRSGARLNNLLTIAKLTPLLLIITLGVARFGQHFEVIQPKEVTSPGWGAWLNALLLLMSAYAGSENALIPSGEVKNARTTIPFGLIAGLVGCIGIYTLVQFVTVATIGTNPTARPLAETASVLIGGIGRTFVTVAVMISTYGWVSGALLNVPRIACSLAAQGDAPTFLGQLHPNFNTPSIAIVLYAALVWLLATTGAYLGIVALSAGAVIVIYVGSCAALIRLRQVQPQVNALRIPCGQGFAVVAILVWLAVLARLDARGAFLMGITAAVAAANWWWAKRKQA
jgi:APA family basic amino acid/polyamine antiporter